ncbi:MAG: biotin/lipoyl-binding protein, partial [Chitinophagaceae bacterium]|nr:biotin/lipoyl-binding protein [Chitinophagaceae bacterium]
MIKKVLILLMLMPFMVFAHGGEDHGEAKKSGAKPATYFSSEAESGLYELILKYPSIEPNKSAGLKLFISNVNTNAPIDSVSLQIKVAGNPNIKLEVSRIDKGIYEISGIFPEKKSYNLTVNINSLIGPDLLLLSNIEIGRQLEKEINLLVHNDTHWYKSNLFFGVAGALVGILAMFFFMKKRNRKIPTALIIFFGLVPTTTYHTAFAHGGEDHGSNVQKGGVLSTTFMVEKETQFLFGILTQKIGTENFYQSSQVLGTIIPSPQGRAVIQSPQTGKIVSLKVSVGQKVFAGQILAVIEQQIDAGTQINILSQKNAVDAEFNA